MCRVLLVSVYGDKGASDLLKAVLWLVCLLCSCAEDVVGGSTVVLSS